MEVAVPVEFVVPVAGSRVIRDSRKVLDCGNHRCKPRRVLAAGVSVQGIGVAPVNCNRVVMARDAVCPPVEGFAG